MIDNIDSTPASTCTQGRCTCASLTRAVTSFAMSTCHAVPTLSFRALFGFVVAGVLVNGERSLAIVVTSTFQAGVILLVTAPLIMTRVELPQESPE